MLSNFAGGGGNDSVGSKTVLKKIGMRAKRKWESQQKSKTLVASPSLTSLFQSVMKSDTPTVWEAFFW